VARTPGDAVRLLSVVMPTPRQAHRVATRVLSLTMIGIGVAIVVRTVLAGGGGGLGFLLGAMFIALGAGRLYLQSRSPDA
jgi:hypothetical protein